MSAMDPEVKAVEELNVIFQRLEVPVEVLMSEAEGKHVRAADAIAASHVLFEEVPMTSWPSPLFAYGELRDAETLCFYCLRRKENSSSATEVMPEEEVERQWTSCDACGAHFCSNGCRSGKGSAAALHQLLCGPARERLRRAEVAALHSHKRKGLEGMEQGITLEALARCAAWLITRIGQTIQQAKLPASTFAARSEPSEDAVAVEHLQQQIFAVASAPFNRLLAAPDNTVYKSIEPPLWKAAVREALQSSAGGYLNSCCAEESAGTSTEWSTPLLEAVLSDATLQTMLGQLALNAHAINTALPTCTATASSVGSFEVVVKGAGLYGLLACFNHSCEPNLVVSHPHQTHELEVKAIRDIAKGESLCISYIPLGDSSEENPDKATVKANLNSRREQLRQYFFECQCPRCVREAELCEAN